MHQHNPTTTGRIGTNEKQCGGCCSSGGPAHARTRAHVYVYVVHAHVGVSQLMSGCYCYHAYYTHTYTGHTHRETTHTSTYIYQYTVHASTHTEKARERRSNTQKHTRAQSTSASLRITYRTYDAVSGWPPLPCTPSTPPLRVAGVVVDRIAHQKNDAFNESRRNLLELPIDKPLLPRCWLVPCIGFWYAADDGRINCNLRTHAHICVCVC